MFIRNAWYVAAWSSEISTDALFSRTVLGVPVVMWRDAAGAVHALEDRCCHRGAPLSRGRLEDGQVRCMYHGLLFASDGRCVDIPAQDRIPPGMRVRTYPVIESTNWVWVWMGEPSQADPALVPDTWWLDHDEWRYREGYLHYDVGYLLVTDNLLDFSHLPFVHPNTVGGDEGFARQRPKLEWLDDGVRISRWHLASPPAPFVRAVTGWTEPVDRWNVYDFVLPGILLMHSGSAPAGTGAPQGRLEGAVQFRSAQAVTPATEDSCHYFFSQAHNFSIEDPAVTDTVHRVLLEAFDEDREMIHAQHASLAGAPDLRMAPIGADAALNRFRWLVERRLRQEAAPAGTAQERASVACATP